MAKALVFSDLHVHAHKGSVERLHDCLKVLHWVFETADQQEVDHIFFLGDLFHEQTRIDVLNYLRTFEVFMEHMLDSHKRFDVHLLVGNHDTYHKQRWDVNSVKPLTALPRVHLIDKPTSLEIGGQVIDWMPHSYNPREALESLASSSSARLLLGHLAINGAQLNQFYGVQSDVIVEYDNDMELVDAGMFSHWDLTLLGHYHGSQSLAGGKVKYVGSPLQISFGEVFQEKHVLILDLETLEHEYIVNEFSPKHIILSPEDIENETYDLQGNFVRVSMPAYLRHDEFLSLKKKIKTQQPASLDFKAGQEQSDDEETVLEDTKQILYKKEEMVRVWLEECDKGGKIPKELDKAHLDEIGKLICSETKI